MGFKFDLLLEIEVPRPWDERKERDRFHEAIEQVVFAEEMGFDTVWVVEHHFTTELAHSSAPEVLLGTLADAYLAHSAGLRGGAAAGRGQPPDPGCRAGRDGRHPERRAVGDGERALEQPVAVDPVRGRRVDDTASSGRKR